MQRVVPSLLIAARVLAICAVLAGLAAGLLVVALGAFLICIDGCPSREAYFSNTGLGAVRLLTPCVVLAALALVVFLTYCLATRQLRRAVSVILVFLVGGLLAAAALNALLQHGNATLEVTEGGFLAEGPARAWARQWALALLLVAVVWSAGLVCLQWGRRWRAPSQRAIPS